MFLKPALVISLAVIHLTNPGTTFKIKIHFNINIYKKIFLIFRFKPYKQMNRLMQYFPVELLKQVSNKFLRQMVEYLKESQLCLQSKIGRVFEEYFSPLQVAQNRQSENEKRYCDKSNRL